MSEFPAIDQSGGDDKGHCFLANANSKVFDSRKQEVINGNHCRLIAPTDLSPYLGFLL
jgi:hypothetical protein